MCHPELVEGSVLGNGMEEKQYYVYILTNRSRTLYIGVTSNLRKRIWEHKNKIVEGFTKKYHIDQLVYYEQTEDVMSALEREKQLKKWRREKKIWLIEQKNPSWRDLADDL
jgi:putative endonuclease